MKRISCLLLALLLCLSAALVACDKEPEEHVHTFADSWNYDEANHWHDATCEHSDQVSDKGAHVDADGNDICDVCGYIADHTHTYAEEWSWDEENHFHKSSCGHNVKKDEAAHADENNDGLCDVCTYDFGHVHTYEEGWTGTPDGHWHAPTCGHDVDGSELTPHADENNDGDCDVCGYNGGHEHTYAEEWSTDTDNHWREVTCGHSIPVGEKGAHADKDGDGACDTCGYVPEHFHTFEDTLSYDENGHFYKATCGHDVRDGEEPHADANDDGVCDTCTYVIFVRYTVTVTLPEYAVLVAPDGSSVNSFLVKQDTEATFTVSIPKFAALEGIRGAEQVGEPVEDGEFLVYTLKVANLTADCAVTVSARKLTAVEVVAEVTTALPITQQFNNTMELTLTVPGAGLYAVYSTLNDGVEFGDENGTAIYHRFNATEAGDVTVLVKYFAWSVPESGEHPFTYVLVKLDDPFALPALEGEGYTMPTNVPITLTFVLPTPGLWGLSSSVTDIAWNDELASVYFITTTQPNEEVSVTMQYTVEGYSTFLFDWRISGFAPVTVAEGDTPMTVPYGDYTAITFTAPAAGNYRLSFTHTDAYFYAWDSTYNYMAAEGNGLNLQLNAGETVSYYVSVYAYGETTADIEDVLTVENLGNIPSYDYEQGGYPALSGTQNAFENDGEAGDFSVSVPEGCEISFDGGATWHSALTVSVEAYGTVTYLVRGADTVVVTIERIAYEFTLTVGTQTVNLVPGKEYMVTLTGFASQDYYKTFILDWSNKDVSVVYNGTVTPGVAVGQYTSSYTMLILLTADAAADVTFTLSEPSAETEAPETEAPDQPEEPETEEPGGITIPTVEAGDTTPALLDGQYRVKFVIDGLFVLTFTPEGYNYGKLHIEDNNNNRYDGTYTYTYGTAEGVVVYGDDGAVTDVIIGVVDGGLTFQCYTVKNPQKMNFVEGSATGVVPPAEEPETVTELSVGKNAVEVTDAWNGHSITFTATEAGTYTLSADAGETNASVGVGNDWSMEWVDLPYTFTLEAGETFTFVFATANFKPDVVNVVLTKN